MRAIEPIKDIARPTSLGPVPELRWLPIASLVVDDAYQRPLLRTGLTAAARIGGAFNWLKFGPVVVSPVEGGVYSIIDGQHRATAAASIGVKDVPCLIVQADRREQAAAFEAINGAVTAVSSQAKLKALLVAGDPIAVAVKRACDAAGVTIVWYNTTSSNLKPGETCSPALIGKLIAKYNEGHVAHCLRLIRDNDGKSSDLLGMIIQGVVEVLAENEEWRSDARLTAVFKTIRLYRIFDVALRERKPHVSQALAFRSALVTKLHSVLSREDAA